jgi:glutaredoxin
MRLLRLITRADCELCERMRAELERLGRGVRLPELQLVDVDADPELVRRYGLHVPVLLLDDTLVCRHHLDGEELLRLLRPRGPAAG